MSGMRIVPVSSDSHGNIDKAELRLKAEQYRDELAAVMVRVYFGALGMSRKHPANVNTCREESKWG